MMNGRVPEEDSAPGPRSAFGTTIAIAAVMFVLLAGSLTYVAFGIGPGFGATGISTIAVGVIVLGLSLSIALFAWRVGRTRGWF